MSTKNNINYDGVEEFDLAQYCEEAYLNYATYVIKDRVLPYIGDGLKPVQRRIIYTMAIEGIDSKDKKKKSAYTVGQVLGRFHPHGDSACYESLVIMAQNFSYRYPLIGGQGNFGEVFDPKGFAAMRYTEAFLSPYANALLTELNSGNVNFQDNYTGDEKEPRYLPAILPNIILNGTTGIAVGMATDIPPHNINEVVDACCLLIDKPHAELEEVMQHIQGPDYPTGAEINNSFSELYEIYKTGRGTIRQRAVWHAEKEQITITELPAQAAPNLIPKIAQLIQDKKITNILDIRDESSENELKIILYLKRNKTDVNALMNQLCSLTDLEKTQRVNLNMIGLNDKPAVKGLVEILSEWLIFRKEIVRRRYEHELTIIARKLMRIEGFLIAFNNLDKVIEIVRYSPKAKEELIATFALTEEQATAILDLRVRELAKLEEDKLRKNKSSLLKQQKQINHLLENKKAFDQQIKSELIEAKAKFGNERKSKLVEYQSQKLVVTQPEVESEPVTVVISKNGLFRCGKGHEVNLENIQYRNNDSFAQEIKCLSTDTLYVFDSIGRVYNIQPNQIPNLRSAGAHISQLVNFKDKTKLVSVFTASPEQFVLLASTDGNGFLTTVANLETKNKGGKAIFSLDEETTELLSAILVPTEYSEEAPVGQYECLVLSNQGRILKFELKEIPARSKSSGVRLIKFEDDDSLAHVFIVNNKSSLLIQSGKRSIPISANDLNSLKSSRGYKGRKKTVSVAPNSIITVK
ncbi:DNA topoisomerase IV subunit A [Psittacicella hinzii]|uniref:DNA topoisomerase (ATP-hydrolyzing) n=1 Tax=Psittacicella hinzii TaxID=2028575 RepID=A0A3A1Y759_9GAMM|nr:DNA topoisomerase IV subunit A [Psittacicella hinzii]RIY34113.1 DNA topoisomerase IV subunit A [Psittacicella hinzii]